MWTDPIVEEVRRVRQGHAAMFNYDLDAIYADIKARQEASGRKYVRFSRKSPVDPVSTDVNALPPRPTGELKRDSSMK
jgi:hypothetical protein